MRRTIAAVFLLLLFLGCAVYGPSLLVDGGVDAGTQAAGEAGVSCDRAFYPPRPAADDPGGDAGEIVLALHTIRFDVDAGGGELLGYDLDRACTCPGASSCVPAGDAAPACDDSRGRDNSAGVLLDKFLTLTGGAFDTKKFNGRIAQGDFTMLVRIRDWNGQPNDTQVTVQIFLSNGTKGSEDGGTPTLPKFDGTDVWTLDPNTVFGGVGPPYVPLIDAVDTTAYMSDGTLVAAIGEVNVNFAASTGSGSIKIRVTGAVFTGRPTPFLLGGWKVDDGLLAGRWQTRNFLTAFATIQDPLGSGYLCGDSGTYQAIRKLICDSRDIAGVVQNDNTNAPCDAVSLGFGFTAKPARLGNLNGKPAPPQPCGAMWLDDCK